MSLSSTLDSIGHGKGDAFQGDKNHYKQSHAKFRNALKRKELSNSSLTGKPQHNTFMQMAGIGFSKQKACMPMSMTGAVTE